MVLIKIFKEKDIFLYSKSKEKPFQAIEIDLDENYTPATSDTNHESSGSSSYSDLFCLA